MSTIRERTARLREPASSLNVAAWSALFPRGNANPPPGLFPDPLPFLLLSVSAEIPHASWRAKTGTTKATKDLEKNSEETIGREPEKVLPQNRVQPDLLVAYAPVFSGRWPTRTADFHLVRVAL